MSSSPTSHRFIELLGSRWTLAVLAQLDGGRRYQELHEALDGISHKVLTETLRRAERDGLITRHLDPGHVETATLYELTELGRSLTFHSPHAASGWTPTGSRWMRPAIVGISFGEQTTERGSERGSFSLLAV